MTTPEPVCAGCAGRGGPGADAAIPALYDVTITTGHHIRDARAVHRALQHDTYQQGRTLWAQAAPCTVIIRTPVAGIAWDRWPHARSASVTTTTTCYAQGTRLTWALIANPTRAVPVRGRRGKRVALSDTASVTTWAREHLQPALGPGPVRAQRLQPARGADGLLLGRWALCGTAEVADPAHLQQLLALGVGRGRAFGCGLLLARQDTA